MFGLFFDIFARDKTGQAFASVKNNVDGLNKNFDKVSKTLGAFKSLMASALALNFLKGAAEAAELINDLSTRLGISAEVLSQYQLVANNTGVGLENIATAMQKLAKSSVDAAEKGGEAGAALQSLGINAQQFATLPIDQKFAMLATAIQGVEDPSKRVQLAMTLMGKSGAEMLQVMADGGAGLEQMQRQADGLGITLNNVETSAIDSMMDAIGTLGLQVLALGQHFIAQLAPAVEFVAKVLQVILAGAIVIVRDGFKSLIAMILNTVGTIANAFSWLTDKLSVLPGEVGEAFARMSASLANYGDMLTSVTIKTDDASSVQSKYKGNLDETAESVEKVNKAISKSKPDKPFKDAQKSMENARTTSGEAAEGMKQDWNDASNSMEQDIGRAISGISLDFNDLEGTALKALEAIGKAILENIINQQFGNSGGGGGGGGFGGFGGGGGGFDLGGILNQASDWFGGFFADGGNFFGGKPIVVGERGPEMIMPRGGGTVIPNEGMGRSVNVQMNISTPDAASFRRSQGQIAASMAQAVKQGSRNL